MISLTGWSILEIAMTILRSCFDLSLITASIVSVRAVRGEYAQTSSTKLKLEELESSVMEEEFLNYKYNVNL